MRRRRAGAAVVLAALAIGAFAFGARWGTGRVPPRPSRVGRDAAAGASWRGSGSSSAFDGTAVSPRLREAIRAGTGRRASSSSPRTSPAAPPAAGWSPPAGDSPPAEAAPPAAGDDRPGGRPGEAGRRRADRSARRDGRPRRRLRAPPRAPHRRQPARPRRQRRPRPGARRRPPGRGDRRHRTRLRRHRGAGRRHRGAVRRRRSRPGAWRRPRKHFPGSAPPAKTPTSRPSGSTSPRRELRAIDERALPPPTSPPAASMVMLSTAIYPAFSPAAPPPSPRAIVTGELRHRLGFQGVTITDAWKRPRSPNSAAPRSGGRRRPRRRRPAPLRRPAGPAARARRRWSRSCAPAAWTAPSSRPPPSACSTCAPGCARGPNSGPGTSSRDPRPGRRPGPRRGPRPWPRTSPCRPRRRRWRRWSVGRRRTSRRRR